LNGEQTRDILSSRSADLQAWRRILTGGHGNDRLYGDDGSDELVGGHGHDVICGGDADDLFIVGDVRASRVSRAQQR
jgi:Ca2+-binding RTX toxin-like protein